MCWMKVVWKWCNMFNDRRTNVQNEECYGWPLAVTDTFLPTIEETNQQDKRFTIDGLSLFFPEISQSVLYIKLLVVIWIRTFLGSNRDRNDELKQGISEWLNNLAATEYAESRQICETVHMCSNLNSNYLGK